MDRRGNRNGNTDDGSQLKQQKKNKERQQKAMKFWKDNEPHFAFVAEREALNELWDEIS